MRTDGWNSPRSQDGRASDLHGQNGGCVAGKCNSIYGHWRVESEGTSWHCESEDTGT